MMAFPSMLIEAAKQAGMRVPVLDETDEFSAEEFPHFHVFCNVQLCRPIQWGEHWENAKVVAAIPEKRLKKITLNELIQAGLQYQS